MTALMMAECQGSRDIARLLEIAGASQTMRDDVRFWNSEQWSRGDGCRGVESCEYDRRQLNSTTPQLLNRQRTAFRVAVHATRTPDVRQRSRVRSAPPRPLFSSDPGTSRRSYPRRLEDTWATKSYGGGRAECSGSTGKSLRKRAVSCPVGMAYPSSQATPPFLNALFHCYSVQSSNSFRQPAPPYIQLEMEEADESNSDHEQSVSGVRLLLRELRHAVNMGVSELIMPIQFNYFNYIVINFEEINEKIVSCIIYIYIGYIDEYK